MYVVEDDVDIAHLVQHQLQQSGYQVRTFSSGSSVFSEAVKQQPILFMLDIMIPGINGFDLCKQIRANEVLAKTPIIFLTAKGNESDRLAGKPSRSEKVWQRRRARSDASEREGRK